MDDIFVLVVIETRVVKMLIHANIKETDQSIPLPNDEIFLTLQIFNAHK